MGAQAQSWLSVAIYLGIFIAIFYFFIIAPRKKQEKKHKDVLSSLKRGDKIVSIGGLKGEITRIMDDSVLIKVNEGNEIEILKRGVAYKEEAK